MEGKTARAGNNQDNLEAQAQQCSDEDLNKMEEWIKIQEMWEQESKARVKQDQLNEVNLGKEGEEKNIRMSAKLEEEFE